MNRRIWFLIASALLSTVFCNSSFAGTWSWTNAGSGDYMVAGNWSGGVTPSGYDVANIDNGGTAVITGADAVTNQFIMLGNAVGGPMNTLNISGGTFVAPNYGAIYVGNYSGGSAKGTVNQSGGSVGSRSNYFSVRLAGNSSSNQGYYNLSGGTLTIGSGQFVQVGYTGTGVFTQTGGTLKLSGGSSYIGIGNRNAGSNGTYRYMAGSIAQGLPTDNASLTVGLVGATNTGTFRGNGVVALTGSLTNNGQIIAEGYTAASIAGVVNLQNYVGDVTTVPVTIEIQNTAGNSVIETHTVNLDSAGRYSFTLTSALSSGNYIAAAKASHWLAQDMPFTITSSSSVSDSLLDLSSFGSVGSSVTSAANGYGWYAQSAGSLKLPPISVAAGSNTYNWGEDPSHTSINLVNSAQFTFHNVTTAGTFSGMLFASSHSLPTALPPSAINAWNFSSGSLGFGTVDLTVRYDNTAVASQGITESNLKLMQLQGNSWVDLGATVDTTNHRISATGLTSLGYYTVGPYTTTSGGSSGAIPDFTFVQITDEHANSYPESAVTVAEVSSLGTIDLSPAGSGYNVTALKPSFILETGDITDMGPINASWTKLNSWYASCPFPRYLVVGNHDASWGSLRPDIQQYMGLHGTTYYSFNKNGCHFVVLDSAGILDPDPVITPEEMTWLAGDLASTGTTTPVFITFHHPVDDPGWQFYPYNIDHLLDVVRPYNVILFMNGHVHYTRSGTHDGFNYETPDSAFGGDDEMGYNKPAPDGPGYMIMSVLNGTLRVVFKETGQSLMVPMLQKPLAAPATRYPTITVQSPTERTQYTYGSSIPVKVTISGLSEPLTSVSSSEDGWTWGSLTQQSDGSYQNSYSPAAPGARYMVMNFTGQSGTVYHHAVRFYSDSNKVAWRTYMGAGAKSSPTVSGNSVFVGTNDGFMHAYNTANGQSLWNYQTGSAVTSTPLVLNGNVYFGSEDGYFYCVNASTGNLTWKFSAGDAVYNTPVTDSTSVYFGTRWGAFYSVNASTGVQNWKSTASTYNIKDKPLISGGNIYYGCYDGGFYCLNTSNGNVVWKYSGSYWFAPAECSPVLLNGKIYVPHNDNGFSLLAIDSTGTATQVLSNVTTVAPSSDGNLYVRLYSGVLEKVSVSNINSPIWSYTYTTASDDAISMPVEVNGVVYICSKLGVLSALNPNTGALNWQYTVTPYSWVVSNPCATGTNEFISGTDGVLTSLTP
jgi:outer membrane protein assembly factor BamB